MDSTIRQRQSAASDAPKPALEKQKSHRSLLTWEDLPEWSKDNEYIKTGFRPTSNSYIDSFRSCFYIQNETGNIYSHFLATLWMILLPTLYYAYAKRTYPTANSEDCIVFGLFFLGGTLCFGLSTAYHVLSNHSHAVHDVFHRLDLLGISTVTAGCFPPGMWYTFPCEARSTKMLWISVDLAAQILAAIFVLFVSRFRKPKWRPLRGALFSFMASSAFGPIMYACFMHGYSKMDLEAGASRYAITVVVYLTAVSIYATRIPEAWRPGLFDVWGQSHQVFHVLMAVGLTVHFSAFVKAFDYAHTAKRC